MIKSKKLVYPIHVLLVDDDVQLVVWYCVQIGEFTEQVTSRMIVSESGVDLIVEGAEVMHLIVDLDVCNPFLITLVPANTLE